MSLPGCSGTHETVVLDEVRADFGNGEDLLGQHPSLAVLEEHLEDVIHVIRRGLQFAKKSVDPSVVEQLTKWCDDEEAYLQRLRG